MIARCDCNGHGDGLSCPLNKQSGSRKCDCLDNTCGDRCEKCCPAYNQYPWKKGSRTSWISDSTTACESMVVFLLIKKEIYCVNYYFAYEVFLLKRKRYHSLSSTNCRTAS